MGTVRTETHALSRNKARNHTAIRGFLLFLLEVLHEELFNRLDLLVGKGRLIALIRKSLALVILRLWLFSLGDIAIFLLLLLLLLLLALTGSVVGVCLLSAENDGVKKAESNESNDAADRRTRLARPHNSPRVDRLISATAARRRRASDVDPPSALIENIHPLFAHLAVVLDLTTATETSS